MGAPRLAPGERGEISVFPRGKRYQAKARLRLLDGTYRQASGSGATKKAAKAACEAAADKIFGTTTTAAVEWTDRDTLATVGAAAFAQWYTESTWAGARRKVQTVEAYEADWRRYVLPGLGALTMRELSGGLVQAWVNKLAEERSAATVARSLIPLSQVLAWSREKRIIHTDPLAAISAPKPPTAPPRAMDAYTVGSLRCSLRRYVAARAGKPGSTIGDLPLIVDVMLGAGLRIGETLALRWCDFIALPDGRYLLDINSTMVTARGRTFRQDVTKTTSSDREVIIPPFLVEQLLTHRARSINPVGRVPVADRRIETTGRSEGGTDTSYIFPARQRSGSTGQNPRMAANVRRSLRTALDWASLRDEDIHPHLMRSTVATVVSRARENVVDAARLLGHKVTDGAPVTVNHYIERMRRAPDVSDAIQTFIEASEALIPSSARCEATKATQAA